MKAKWSKERICKSLQQIPNKVIYGSWHYQKLKKQFNLPSDWVLHNYYNGLKNACKECNIKFISRHQSGNIAFKEHFRKSYTKKEIENILINFSVKNKYITDILERVRKTKRLLLSICLLYGNIDTQNHREVAKLFNKVLHKYNIEHIHHQWTKKLVQQRILSTYKYYGPFNTSELNKALFRTKYNLPNYSLIKKYFSNFKNAIKSLNLYDKQFFIGEKQISKFASYCQGRNEDKILNTIEQKLGYKLLRQVRIGKYYVDGYDENNNIVYEVDESHHQCKYQQRLDREREQNIKNLIGCSFIRINEMEVI